MERSKPHVVSCRVDEELFERIVRFAYDNELYNSAGDPNISAAVALLVSLALEESSGGDYQRLIREAYDAGRNQTISVMRSRFDEWITAIRRELS